MSTMTFNPIRADFFRRVATEDFRTIFSRQLAIVQRGEYKTGRQIQTRMRWGGGMGQRSGTLERHLAAAGFTVDGNSLTVNTNYPIYIRFLDMKRKGNWQIYNRQIWGVVYNNMLAELKEEVGSRTKEEIREQLTID